MSRPEQQRETVRVHEILFRLEEEFPDVTCALKHQNAFQLLVATILSAQCTDVRVNKVTPLLFARFPDPRSMASASSEDLEEIIRSTGFFRNKARNLRAAAALISDEFLGEVPASMDDLLRLPGVARKTANVVLGTWFGMASGVVVDTHVGRIANRLGFTVQKDPKKIEKDLMKLIPEDQWVMFSHRAIHHGRRTCKARNPRCGECRLADLCPYAVDAEGPFQSTTPRDQAKKAD